MSWPAGQQRVLEGIEETLVAGDQRLGALFALFTRLADGAAMPQTERLPPSRVPRLALLAAAGLMAVTMFLVTFLTAGQPACPATAMTASVFSSSVARPAAACPPVARR